MLSANDNEAFETNWLQNPIKVVDGLHESDCDIVQEVTKFYENILKDYDVRKKVPSITHFTKAKQELLDKRLVKFTGMIKDMHDPEYCVRNLSYRTADCDEIKRKTLLFKEFELDDTYVPNENDEFLNRNVFTCVVEPSATQWAEEFFKPSINLDEIQCCLNSLEKNDTAMDTDEKKPIHTECIIKIHEENVDKYTLCQTLEFYGILYKSKADQSHPVIHCVYAEAVEGTNPHLFSANPDVRGTILQNVKSRAMEFRNMVIELFAEALGGDQKAATYLLANTLSKIYARDPVEVGKFSINLTKLKPEYVPFISNVLKALVPKYSYIPMKIEYLNNHCFWPIQDADTLQLKPGVLQLSPHTTVLIDETVMEGGQLIDQGVRNIDCLQKVITLQALEYEFPYFKKGYDVDLRCIVCSEGKSMLRCGVVLPVKRTQEPSNNKLKSLNEEMLINLRLYLSLMPQSDFTISTAVTDKIPVDYARMRSDNEELGAEDLHRMLTCARYLCLSEGEQELQVKHWDDSLKLESMRLERLPTKPVDKSVTGNLDNQLNATA